MDIESYPITLESASKITVVASNRYGTQQSLANKNPQSQECIVHINVGVLLWSETLNKTNPQMLVAIDQRWLDVMVLSFQTHNTTHVEPGDIMLTTVQTLLFTTRLHTKT